MCEVCEKKAAELAHDEAFTERLVEVAYTMHAGIAQLATAVGSISRLPATPAAVALYAAMKTLAEQVHATWGPEVRALADRVQKEVAKESLVADRDSPTEGLAFVDLPRRTVGRA